MKNLTLITLSLLILTGNFSLNAQSAPDVAHNFSSIEIAQGRIQSSPDVSAIGRYAMTQPNLNNGQPSQHIPIYTLNDNGISYPISINYAFSGWRPGETASSIGLGWSLSENVIIRIVHGLPDGSGNMGKQFEDHDYNNFTFDVRTYTDGATSKTYNLTANRSYYKIDDTEPDEYIYTAGAYSGRFVWLDGKAIQYPYTGVKIQRTNTPHFIITTPDGIMYNFYMPEFISDPKHWNEAGQAFTSQYKADFCDSWYSTNTYNETGYETAWRPNWMANLNTRDTIHFEYGFYKEAKTQLDNDVYSRTFSGENGLYGLQAPAGFPSYHDNNFSYISNIKSTNYKIDFTYSGGGGIPFRQNLDFIKVYNRTTNSLIFQAGLTHGQLYEPVLNTIQLTGLGKDEKFAFAYLDTFVRDPAVVLAPQKNEVCIDHWGYANGAFNTTLIPKPYNWDNSVATAFTSFLASQVQWMTWADRSPRFRFAITGALHQITYPTGGTTTYTYESANGRGIRVKATQDNAGYNAPVVSKFYVYEPEVPGGDAIYNTLSYIESGQHYTCTPIDPTAMPWSTRNVWTLTASTLPSLLGYDDNPILYEKVTEFLGSPTGAYGKNVYFYDYDFFSKTPYLLGVSSYDNLSALKKSSNLAYTKQTLTSFSHPSAPLFNNPGNVRPCASGSVLTNYILKCDAMDPDWQYTMSEGILMTIINKPSVWWKKTSETETEYANAGNIVKSTQLSYLPVIPATGLPFHTQPVEISSTLSNGETGRLKYYYPGDPDPANPSATLGVAQMWDPANAHFKSMCHTPVLTRRYVANNLVEEIHNSYSYNATNNIVQLNKVTHIGAGNQVIKTILPVFDEKNRLLQMGTNDRMTSFVRDYNRQYVTAKATNAAAGDIGYTSFETPSFDKFSTVSDANCTTSDKLSGNRSYWIDHGLSMANLNHNKQYVVALWAKNVIPAFTGYYNLATQIPTSTSYWKQGELVNGWRYLEYTFTGVHGIHIGASSAGLVDDVRVFPADAKMETICYSDAGLITSKADENGRILYYEYDNAGRLLLTRDADKNIIEKHEYGIQATE